MSEYVEVPFEGQAKDRAVLLLAAAEDVNQPSNVVQTRTGAFYVPQEVAEKAGLATSKSTADDSEQSETKPRKRAAKKSSSNKTQE